MEEADLLQQVASRIEEHNAPSSTGSSVCQNNEAIAPSPSRTGLSPSKSIIASESFPLVFIQDNALYKVGEKEKPDPDGTRGTWWKRVSLKEAEEIMGVIAALAPGRYRQSEIRDEVIARGALPTLPIYRVDVVITALLKINALSVPTRGYYSVAGGTPQEWLHVLERYPKRGDLLSAKK